MADEAYIEMRCYIKYNLYYGQGEQAIRQNLINAGWPAEKINQAFMELKSAPTQEVKKAPAQKAKAGAAKQEMPEPSEQSKGRPGTQVPEAPIAAPVPSGK